MENFELSAELLEMFFEETYKSLENIESLLLEAEENGYTGKIVDEIFRDMHSMKGSSATMGFENIAKLSHAMEDIFAILRKDGSGNIDSSWLTSMLLICKDFLSEELVKINNGKKADGDVTELVSEIRKQIEHMEHYDSLPKNTTLEEEHIVTLKTESVSPQEGFRTYFAKIFFNKDSGMPNVRALILIQKINECMLIREHVPYELTNENSENIILKKGFQVMFDSELDIVDVRKFIESNVLCMQKLELSTVSSDDSIKEEQKFVNKEEKEESTLKKASSDSKISNCSGIKK